MNASWIKAVSNTAPGFTTDWTSLFPRWQVGLPSAVILLQCSVDTMSGRLQARRRSTLSRSDSDRLLHRRAESFCSDNQALISHYENKSILHMVRFPHLQVQIWPPIFGLQLNHFVTTYKYSLRNVYVKS